MNFKRIFSLTLVLWALVAFVIPVSAPAADGKDDLSVYFRPAVRFGTDDRVLYILDFLVPVYRGNKDLLFLNAKFTPDNHRAWETNLGVGYRRLVLDDKLVLGGNLFYDHRKTRYGSHFDQLGLGFEAMAEPGGIGLTGRFNYYQPLTKAKLGGDFGYVFYGNGIYTAGIEEAMTGFDYEAGVRIPWVSNYVETWAYAGGYHYFGCHTPDVNGVSARIEATPTDFLKVSFEFRDDTVNNEEFYGEISFEVPFSIDNLVAGKNPFEGIGDVLTGSRTLKERMVEPVHRDVDIVVGKDYLSATDAGGGEGHLAAGVIFVADNADTGGDGSFEHPYDSLTDANNDARLGDTVSIVHVLTGDGTGLAGESFGQDGITIWGAGANNPAYPYVTNFAQGYPLINSNLHFYGADMTVLGLDIETSDYAAVSFGGDAFESGFSFFANRVYNNGTYGISFEGPDGIGTAASPVSFWGNTISVEGGSGATGIYLESYGSDIYARIYNNVLEDIYAEGYASGIDVNAGGDLHASITGNTIIDIEAEGYDYTDAGGISVHADYDFLGSISGNTIIGVGADGEYDAYACGIYAEAENDFLGSITGNRIFDIYSYSDEEDGETYGIDAQAGRDFVGSISNNSIEQIEACGGDDVYAAGISGYAYRDFIGSISGNTITDVWSEDAYDDADAYGIDAYASGDFLGSISRNTIRGIWAEDVDEDADVYGISAWASGDFVGSISDNTVTDIWAEYIEDDLWLGGIYGGASNYFSGSISGNRISYLEAHYIDDDARVLGIEAEAGNVFSGSVSRNTVGNIEVSDVGDDAYAEGIALNFYDWWYDNPAGSFSGSISGNTISSISSYDCYYYPESDGIFVNADYLSGSISGNTISEILSTGGYASGITALSEHDFSGSVSNNIITSISGYGISGWFYPDGIWFAVDSGDFTGSITGNTITGVTSPAYKAGGIEGDIYNGSFMGTISGNRVTGVSTSDLATALELDVYGDILGSITGNVLSVSAGTEATGISLWTDNGSLGTLSSSLLITSNSGSVNAPTAYLAYLYTNYPELSSVFIGHNRSVNNFTTTGAWNGNYPYAGGKIWASDNGSFINR